MPRALILIPTYNEAENIAPLVDELLALPLRPDLLVIDDNSPDGTGQRLDDLRAGKEDRLHVIHRPDKQGLGSAYLLGFSHSLNQKYDNTLCMDADFSHAPQDVPRLLSELQHADLVCGSRYVPGGAIHNWPRSRHLLSRGAALYTRTLTRLPVHDPTGGFNAYRNDMLAALPLDRVTCEGYSFQIVMKLMVWRRGYRITELPIEFTERRTGQSKLNAGIVQEALRVVWNRRGET